MKAAWLGLGLLVALFSVEAQGDLAGLQAAVHSARPGQVVEIPPGVYLGQLVVDRAVVLRGPGAQIVHEAGAPGPTLWIRAADVTVEGLEIVGSGEGTRRDHTAVVVSGPRARLKDLVVRDAWSGLWIEADSARVDGFRFRGLPDFPFWERGDGIRVSGASGVQLRNLDLGFVADGVSLENTRGSLVSGASVVEGRYGVHVMFGGGGTLESVRTRRTVVGLMAMETSNWAVARCSFTEGFRTGSAGIRQIRTQGVVVLDSKVSHQASGVELLDVRAGRFQQNQIFENATAWTWGGDNSGTRVEGNSHRGNLIDASGTVPDEKAWVPSDAHNHGGPGPAPSVEATGRLVAPTFSGNFWDAWTGLDLDRDGRGDTPYRFDRVQAQNDAGRLWSGLFLGSPWSVLSQSVPGGDVLDPRPLSRSPL